MMHWRAPKSPTPLPWQDWVTIAIAIIVFTWVWYPYL